jgi:hypothetical protein
MQAVNGDTFCPTPRSIIIYLVVRSYGFLLHGKQTLDILFVCLVHLTEVGQVPLPLL